VTPDPLTRLFRACNPNEALQPSDPRFVQCDSARHGGVAAQLAIEFLRADPSKPMHRLFTGHIGVGKSTELLRLKKLLETPEGTRLEAIYFDVNEHLDPNDLKLADLLVLIASQVSDYLEKRKLPGFTPTNLALQRFWDHVKQLSGSEVTLSEASFEGGIASLTTEIKQGAPSQREVLRKAINAQRTTLRAGVNDLLQMATQALQNAKKKDKPAQGLVIIIDGLEKLPGDQHEDLFFEGCEQMTDLAAHTVYTVPMSLAYHTRFSTLTQAFGHQPVPLPMLHFDAPGGMECLHALLNARFDAAEILPSDVFDDAATRDRLCRQTGGHLRHLFMFLQSASTKVDTLPITVAAVESALRDYRQALARQISGTFWPWLRRFRDGSLASLPDDLPDDIRRDLLHQLLVYEYANGEPRYDVNPVIRDLHNFSHGDPAPVVSRPF
jgi:hypothetical protein